MLSTIFYFVMDYEDVYTHLGEFGRYQIWMFFLLGIIGFPVAFNNMAIVWLVFLSIGNCFVYKKYAFFASFKKFPNTTLSQRCIFSKRHYFFPKNRPLIL